MTHGSLWCVAHFLHIASIQQLPQPIPYVNAFASILIQQPGVPMFGLPSTCMNGLPSTAMNGLNQGNLVTGNTFPPQIAHVPLAGELLQQQLNRGAMSAVGATPISLSVVQQQPSGAPQPYPAFTEQQLSAVLQQQLLGSLAEVRNPMLGQSHVNLASLQHHQNALLFAETAAYNFSNALSMVNPQPHHQPTGLINIPAEALFGIPNLAAFGGIQQWQQPPSIVNNNNLSYPQYSGPFVGVGSGTVGDTTNLAVPTAASVAAAINTNIMGFSAPPPQPQPGVITTTASEVSVTGRPPIPLYITCDDDSLSEYQCMVRKQIELFEAQKQDVGSNAQGRNRPIVFGQVGIRCHHCSSLPPKHRARGAIYYPAKLSGIYQAAQNMASAHLGEHCQHVPADVREELLRLRDRKSSAGGGKRYWADGVRVLGVYEDGVGLRFTSQLGGGEAATCNGVLKTPS